jgi:single-strand DNA-binding protein
MASLNKVILLGNLTRDPEIRVTPSGTNIASFGIAMNRKYTNSEQQVVEEVLFVDVKAFAKTAENIGKFFAKGSPILIEGRLSLNQWDDKATGEKKSKMEVIADTFHFVGSNKNEATAEEIPQPPPPARQAAKPAAAPTQPAAQPRQPSAPTRQAPARSTGKPAPAPAPQEDDVPF